MFAFSALTLLVGPLGRQKEHSACKNENLALKMQLMYLVNGSLTLPRPTAGAYNTDTIHIAEKKSLKCCIDDLCTRVKL